LLNTTDLLDFARCHKSDDPPRDVRRSTAALLSARFPFVSPAGRIEVQCDEPSGDAANKVVAYAADGGYLDTSAASSIVELWPEVQRLIARTTPSECVVPFFLQIDNGYETAGLPPSDPAPNQMAVPSHGRARAPGGVAQAARQAAARLFDDSIIDGTGTRVVADPGERVRAGRPGARYRAPYDVTPRFMRITTEGHPGTRAPLGWVLSQSSREDLDHQLLLHGPDIEVVRHWLDGQSRKRDIEGVYDDDLACVAGHP
jgi:hypothetical protein